MPTPTWSTIPDFGPSDLLTSDVIGQRRVKVESESTLETSIERGNGHALTIEIAVANNQTKYYVLKTPTDKVVRIKGRSITTGGGMRYEPMINSVQTLDTNISSDYVRNMNGLIPAPCLTQLWEVSGVTDGDPIDVVRTPVSQGSAGNSVTYGTEGSERILAKDSEYLLKFDNIDNNEIWCIYSLVWTEEDN